jgi:hypothetical protein
MTGNQDRAQVGLTRVGFALLIVSGLLVATGYVLTVYWLYASVPAAEWDQPLRLGDLSLGYHVGTAILVLGTVVFLGGAWTMGCSFKRQLNRLRKRVQPQAEDCA